MYGKHVLNIFRALAMKEDKDTVMYCDVCSFQTVGMGKLKYHQKVTILNNNNLPSGDLKGNYPRERA